MGATGGQQTGLEIIGCQVIQVVTRALHRQGAVGKLVAQITNPGTHASLDHDGHGVADPCDLNVFAADTDDTTTFVNGTAQKDRHTNRGRVGRLQQLGDPLPSTLARFHHDHGGLFLGVMYSKDGKICRGLFGSQIFQQTFGVVAPVQRHGESLLVFFFS